MGMVGLEGTYDLINRMSAELQTKIATKWQKEIDQF